MRCENCEGKFVGMENGEPQVESMQAEFDGKDSFDLTAQVTGTRVCANCSSELKTLAMDMEGTVCLGDIEDWKALGEEQKALVMERLKDGTADISIDGSGGEVDEGGGGRYKKNMITTNIDYSLEITVEGKGDLDDITLEHNGNLSSENAASEFEEC